MALSGILSRLSKRKPGMSSLVGMSRLKVDPGVVFSSHPPSTSSFVVFASRRARSDSE